MNLTTLANVKAWIPNISNSNSDSLLTSLITSCSSQILAFINRPNLWQTSFNDYFDGLPRSGRVMLQNWPVLSVSSVVISTKTVPVAPNPGAAGWALEPWDGSAPGAPQRVGITGYGGYLNSPGYSPADIGYASNGLLVSSFGSGGGGNFQNVVISYVAGYVQQNEAQTVPGTPYKVTVNCPYGNWVQDQGVKYASTGVALTAVASNPAVGQYVPPSSANVNQYTFAAADTATSMLISYSYVPFALEQGCIEWVGERFRSRDRIGVKSQSIAGQETVAYTQGMSQAVQLLIGQYSKSFPL